MSGVVTHMCNQSVHPGLLCYIPSGLDVAEDWYFPWVSHDRKFLVDHKDACFLSCFEVREGRRHEFPQSFLTIDEVQEFIFSQYSGHDVALWAARNAKEL